MINSGSFSATDGIYSAMGIVITETNTIIVYDQWEDGYELSLTSPTQSTTQIWGDNNPSNGIPPGLTVDILTAGTILDLTNTIPMPRNPAQFYYDGKDKFVVNHPVAITRAQYSTSQGPLCAGAVQAPDITQYGTDFVAPVGTNTSAAGVFSVANMSVIAAYDPTMVYFDNDGDGIYEVSVWLEQGQAYLFTNVLQGAHIHSSKRVMVHMLTGELNSNFWMRWYTLFPTYQWDSVYFAPVGSRTNSEGSSSYADVYLYNPATNTIAVSYSTRSTSGSTNVPSRSTVRYRMPFDTGGKFYTTNGSVFATLTAVDGEGYPRPPGVGQEWGYSSQPQSTLTTMAVCGWGHGSSDLSVNGNPVWVSATTATTIYVDFDANPLTGAYTDPVGNHYDFSTNVQAYETVVLYDTVNNDNDQTGTRVYTLSNAFIAACWGQDAHNTDPYSPYMDMGCEILPFPSVVAEKRHVLHFDANGNGCVDAGDQLQYTIVLKNVGWVEANNVYVYDAVPDGTFYVTNTTTTNGVVLSDNVTNVPPYTTKFPLDETGIFFGRIPVQGTGTVSYLLQVTSPFPTNLDGVANNAKVGSSLGSFTTQDPEVVVRPGLSITKTSSVLATNRLYPGAVVDYTITVSNTGTVDQAMIRVEDVIPPGATYSNNSTWVTTTSETNFTVRDTFAVVSYNNNDGTTNWSGAWQEANDNSNPTSGAARVLGGTAQITTNTSLTRAVNLQGATNAVLSFSWRQSLLSETNNVRDDFGTVSYANNDGSVAWRANWVETGDDSNPSNGTIRVNGGQLQFNNSAASARVDRDVVLTGYTNAILSYSWQTMSLDAGETGMVYVVSNGVPFEVARYGGSASASGSTNIDITRYMATTTGVRFLAWSTGGWSGGGGNADRFYIDNVNILFSRAAFETVDVARVTISTNGSAWTTLLAITGGVSSSTVTTNFNITSYTSTNTQIRFAVTNYESGQEVFYFDDVQVAFAGRFPSVSQGGSPTVLSSGQTLRPGESMTVALQATIDDPSSVTQIVNEASVISAQYPAPLTAFATNLVAVADLSVSKTVNNPSPNTNDLVVYTLTVTNRGPDRAAAVKITDLLPSGVTHVTNRASQGSYAPTSGVWSVGTISNGYAVSLVITGRVNLGTAGQVITNTASITQSNVADPVLTNNSAEAVVAVQSVDLAVSKSVDNATPGPGSLITYTVDVTNRSGVAGTGVRITDLLPTNVTYSSHAVSQGTYVPVSGVWTVGTVNASASVRLTLRATVNSGTQNTAITNTASVTVCDQFDPVSSNNSASAVAAVSGLDLGVTKTVSDANPNTNDLITFTVVVTNYGPTNATSVQVTDLLPSGVTYHGYSASRGTYTSGTGLWDIPGTLTNGRSVSLVITARVDVATGGRAITNSASITRIGQSDFNLANNSASAAFVVKLADLAVTKEVDKPFVDEGAMLTYTVTVTNLGPSSASGVRVSDMLSPDLVFASASPSQGTYTPASGVWTVGVVSASSSAVLTMSAYAKSGTIGHYITNTAYILSSDQQDPLSLNNTGRVVSTVIDARLSIGKTASATQLLKAGETNTYTIVVTNMGNITQTGVNVADLLPAGLTTVAGSVRVTGALILTNNVMDRFNAETYANNDGATNWIGNWDEAGTDDGSASAGDVKVTVLMLQIGGPGNVAQRQANLAGYTNAALSFVYRRMGLAGTNSYVSVLVSSNGYGGTWVEVARLAGPASDAVALSTNVDVTAYISTNTSLRFASSSAMGTAESVRFDDVKIEFSGRFVSTVQGGTPPDVAQGYVLRTNETLTIVFDSTVDDPALVTQLVNEASVTSDQQLDLIRAKVTNFVAQADLGVTKTVNRGVTATNEFVWFTIVATNNGPDKATGIQITDYWPSGITYSNSWASTGSYNGVSGMWSGFSLNAGAGATLVITGRVNTTQSHQYITNRVQVTHLAQYDGNTANDQASARVQTLAVITRVEAFAVDGAGWVEWETSSEIGTVGFNLYRAAGGGARVKVNDVCVPAAIDAPQGGVYRLPDRALQAGVASSYIVEELEHGGRTHEYGPFSVVARTTVRNAPANVEGTARTSGFVRLSVKVGTANAKTLAAAPAPSAVTKSSSPVLLPLKLAVKSAGVYGVSAVDVAAVLGGDPSFFAKVFASGKVRLSNRGRTIPFLYSGNGAVLYFYGEAIESPYTDTNVYWLTWERGATMAVVDMTASVGKQETTFLDTIHFEVDRYAATAVVLEPEGDYWLWDYFIAGSDTAGKKSFVLRADGAAPSTEPASLKVSLVSSTAVGRGRDHHVIVSLNGNVIGEDAWAGITNRELTLTFDQSLLADGENTVEITSVLDPLVSYSIVYLDSYDLSYRRRHEAVGDVLVFRPGENRNVVVGGFVSPGIRVLNVTDPARPKLVKSSTKASVGGGYRTVFGSTGTNGLYTAFTPSSSLPVEAITAGSPSSLRSTANRAKHIIITVPALAGPAERLAQHRRSRGLSSKVVMLQDIYDEFGYGISSPYAVRTFLAYAIASWRERPRYVVLAGEGSYDYKGIKKTGDCIVPPFMMATESSLFATDAPYADPDGDGTAELAVGRLPVMTAEELDAVVDKIVGYETAPAAAWQTVATLSADVPDKGGDFTGSSEETSALVPPGWSNAKVYLEDTPVADARANVVDLINGGTAFLNFFGHGGMDTLSALGLLKTSDVGGMANGDRLPIVTAMSCVIGRFEIPAYDCLGEALVLQPGGGAVAVWAPSGLLYNEPSAVLGKAFYKAVLQEGEGVLGEAILRAKVEAAANGCEASSLALYNLLGDPATVVAGFDAAYGGRHGAGMSLAEWKRLEFGSADWQNESVAGDTADPDDDGLANLAEYVFARNPWKVETDPLFRMTDGVRDRFYDVEVSFTRNRNMLDAGVEVEVSSDLVTWHGGYTYISMPRVTDDGNGLTETVRVMVRSPDREKHTAFIRLRAWKR